jgi:fibronectin type 3 domain-containing protein
MVQWQAPEKRKTKLPVPAQLRFAIERSTGSGGWTRVTTEPIQGTRFLDATVANGGNYIYRVSSLLDEQGVYVWGKSAESGVIVASKMMKPPPPETVWVIPDNGKLQIYWTASDGATEGYHVYRKHNGQITRLTATPVKAPPFVDDNAKANAVYAYAVSAVGLNKPHEEGLLSKWVEFRNVTFQ